MDDKKTTISDIRHHLRTLMRELDVVKGIFLGTGFTYAQCHLMFELSQHSSINPLPLAKKLLLDKSNLSRMVKRLVELGMIRSKQSKIDQRQKELSLTAKGKSLIDRINKVSNSQVSDALEQLSAEQQETVVQGLSLYADALRKIRLKSEADFQAIEQKRNSK